jgi:signal peptidase I
VRVDGNSMRDTLQNNEIMFVTKPEYLFGQPQAGTW